MWALAVHVLCLIAVVVGLSVPEGGAVAWSDLPAWSVLAAVAAVVQLVPAAARYTRWDGRLEAAGIAGCAALVIYWTLIALPAVASTAGLFLTIGVAASVGGCWLRGVGR